MTTAGIAIVLAVGFDLNAIASIGSAIALLVFTMVSVGHLRVRSQTGAATAMLGEKAAMACTEAVEEVIDAHYARQVEKLGEAEPELRATIEKFRAEEIEHRDTARAEGAAEAPGYALLSRGVKAITRGAIWLSERV